MATKRTIVELDLKGYSDVARELEDHFSADLVTRFNDQIQKFVTDALKVCGVDPKDAVMATTGDGAILMFDTPSSAHVFAEEIHHATRQHNHEKTVASAKRWFRIGIATGELAIEGNGGTRKMAGSVIARAVRLEAASSIGEILVDPETYSGLSIQQRACYGQEEQIAGKRNEKFTARRYTVIAGLGGLPPAEKPIITKATPTGAVKRWQQKLEYLEEQLAIASTAAQKFELKCLIDEAREKIAELRG
jgi:class 3 adenylate cyclase